MGGQPPKGQTLGIALCVYKSPEFISEQRTCVDVFFKAGNGLANFVLAKEDADYFSVGQNYSLLATTP